MIRIATACLASATVLLPTVAVSAQTITDPSVTLFSSGMSLVRRSVPVSLPRGTSTQSLPLGIIDPATLTSLSNGVSLMAVEFDGSVDEGSLLRRNIGRIFRIIPGKDAIARQARLLAVAPERWQLLGDNGDEQLGVVFIRPGKLIWPNETVPLAPTTEATLNSDRARNSIEVMYQTSGGSWSADYRLILGKPAMMEGNAIIQTGDLDLANVSVQLLAGNIGRRPAAPRPAPYRAMSGLIARDQVSDFSGQGVEGASSSVAIGSARLYALPGKVTFTPGTELVRSLFANVAVQPELHLVLNSSLPLMGGIGRQPDGSSQPVFTSYRLPHKRGTEFGDQALPGGFLSVYKADSEGRLQLIGAGSIAQVAPGDSVEAAIGTSFDVTARESQTSYDQSREPKTNSTTIEAGYRTVINNAGDSTAKVELRIDRRGDWELLSSSLPAKRISATRTIIPVEVPARGEVTVEYWTRVTW